MKPRRLFTASVGEITEDISAADAAIAFAELSAGGDVPAMEALSRIRRILALYRQPFKRQGRRINYPKRKRNPLMPVPSSGSKAARLVTILERGAMLEEIALLLDWELSTARKRVQEIGRRWQLELMENRYGQIQLRW